MAKTPKVKKKATSVRSRAARRANSPTLKIGDVPSAPKQTTYTPHSASSTPQGIRKRKVVLTRNQKLRRKQVVERADVVTARTEIKKEKSIHRFKKVKERAKDWEDVNSGGKKKKKITTNAFSVLAGMDLDGEQDGMVLPNSELPLRVVDGLETESEHTRIVRFAENETADDDI